MAKPAGGPKLKE